MAPDETGTTPQAPQRKRRGLAWVIWPLLGGALAAAAGYGVAQYVPNGWPMASVVTLQTQVAELSDQVQALQADLQKRAEEERKRLEGEIAVPGAPPAAAPR